MDYFAGLDISMDETHLCVVDRVASAGCMGRAAARLEEIATP
jgi:hypothetical protein